MKNIVLFIIDSFNYSHSKLNPWITPFLDGLEKENYHFENMFSQAPYTEAAVMDIYCGQNVLNNGGYIKRFYHAKKTIFEAMKEKGYVTYYNSFQPQCYASSLRRGIDCLFNNVGYDLSALWSYRLYFYSDLFAKKQLTERDYSLLIDIFDDNFSEWRLFVDKYLSKDKELEMIQSNSKTYDANVAKELLETEYLSYLKNKTDYINNVLREKTNHSIFKIPAFKQDNKIKNKDFIKELQNRYLYFFNEISFLHKRLNKKNCKGTYKGFWRKVRFFVKHPSVATLKDIGKSLKLAINVRKDADLFDRIADDYETFKNAPSVKTHIDHYIRWETNRDKGKPSFSCIHVDDIHNPEVFFTYDSEDIGLIDSEFEDASDVLNNLPANYYGNITHDLSLRYIDTKLKYFYDQLKQNNLLDNTIVLICADHGFSFSGNPLRDSFVINMYLENFNIPCIVTGIGKKYKNSSLCSSKDIPSLLSYFADNIIPTEFEGKLTFMNEEQYDKVFIEYCGGGCPDLNRRKLKIACFNKEWFVASESTLGTPITKNNITEVYNLRDDPLQLNNLSSKKIDCETIDSLISAINARKDEIKCSLTEEFTSMTH